MILSLLGRLASAVARIVAFLNRNRNRKGDA